ncbi:dimethylaniline monooxygenase [Colletotrichum higginsianum]|uniref:Dimethylaniline monooxygenase n=1 Tax=Colletotrichum higginsianum (strain IMI 349063) TaxID=759273 RepID=H1VF92_COLHI|nr:Dimethylaniline monooxygenase [Colletotrichum higginsianum IMI 349063]OBR04454.1 Dimethylaniline monooxygenase [Colletotrichum higginsianum IMI 349063]CCF38895.1 dimethylaniline monooxygenase [Colletotrichum higginsianum]
MAPRYSSVAVIGAGPSGISAVKALSEENTFDRIQLFDRRERIGGTWIYDEEPEPFSPFSSQPVRDIPATLPQSTPPAAENVTARTGLYPSLDSNVGSQVMAFTYKPFPSVNSAASIGRFGKGNPTHPHAQVAGYIEEIADPFSHLFTFNTHVERVEKVGRQWQLTLRKTQHYLKHEKRDYWWQDTFDAVVVATGHYGVPYVPNIPGLKEVSAALPQRFEHSKAYRSPEDYVNKKVVVVGGNVSASDTVSEIHNIVSGPLYLSQRGYNETLKDAWELPNVVRKPQITRVSAGPHQLIRVTFADGTEVDGIEKVHFGTGYRLSYPFLRPDPVTPSGRLSGFYQHVFNVADPSLTIVGQVKGALSFRVYEYQAVAVARYYANRGGGLPSPREQDEWEVKRLQYKGPTSQFHEIKPDFKEYFEFLRGVAGPPAPGTDAYELPAWQDDWALLGFGVLALKQKWWRELKEKEEKKQIQAKL